MLVVVIRKLAVFVLRIRFVAAAVRAVDNRQFTGEGSADSTSLLSRKRSRFWLVIVVMGITGITSGSSTGSEFRRGRVAAGRGCVTPDLTGDTGGVGEAGEGGCD
ncbi:hypothetical protein PC116_g34172 [Phytophthora cactorum]|nr:hypothetical protein PC116_g34172 [Phytophthora cactorum]